MSDSLMALRRSREEIYSLHTADIEWIRETAGVADRIGDALRRAANAREECGTGFNEAALMILQEVEGAAQALATTVEQLRYAAERR